MRRWGILVAYMLMALAWEAARLHVFGRAGVIEFPDSASYLEKAAQPLWTRDFFFGSGRFFVTPLVYKLAYLMFGRGTAILTTTQIALSLAAWLTLAWSLSRRYFASWLGVATFAVTLLFGLSTDVIQWDTAILSESVSTSVFVVLVAWLNRLTEGITIRRVVAAALLAATWAMSREANSLLIVPIALALTLWGMWYLRSRRQRVLSWILASALIASFVASFAISGSGDRWVFPLLNVIGKRVLTSPQRTAFFEARGMPMNDRLARMAGEFGSGQNWAFYYDPNLADFRSWLHAQGRRVWLTDMVTHPSRSFVEPFENVDQLICPLLTPYWSAGFKPLFPRLNHTWLCHPGTADAVITASIGAGTGLAIAAFAMRRRWSSSRGLRLLLVASMLLGWLPFTWFTWHVIGEMEIGRHVWSGVLVFRTGAFLVLVFGLQALGARTISAQPSETPESAHL